MHSEAASTFLLSFDRSLARCRYNKNAPDGNTQIHDTGPVSKDIGRDKSG